MLILTLLHCYLTKLKRNKKHLGVLFKFFSKNLVETENSIVSLKKFSRPIDIMNTLVFCHQNKVFWKLTTVY